MIEVDNPGPTPRAGEAAAICSSRCGSPAPAADSRPHFGLGLYIVRLIAEFHGGHARAEDLPDGSGARFSVHLAL